MCIRDRYQRRVRGLNPIVMFAQTARTATRRVVGRRNFSGEYFFPGHPGDGMGGAQPSLQKEIALASLFGAIGGAWWMSFANADRASYKSFWASYKPTPDEE
eukprot:TRINITY_DN397_c0_g1_i2.p1 TRINITY_DN397_c0_g1~~TRINITY_DN397_c0_g1_i2.p1  ORF type:complete len:102 (+),score=20.49 TRINITY_DN397_c0_g1_i2:148-453(+)